MSMNFETPPVWQAGLSDPAKTDPTVQPRRKSPLAAGSEALLSRLVQQIVRTGSLHVQMPSGHRHAFGQGLPSVALGLTTAAAVWRLLRNPELALGEAYMDGTLLVEHGSVYDLLDLLMANVKMSRGPAMVNLQSRLRQMLRRVIQHNSVARARANVAHHYDLSDTLYELFLDAGRQYSCAYFSAETDTLEQAPAQKMRHIAAKLLLHPGQRVLDIGSGWAGWGCTWRKLPMCM